MTVVDSRSEIPSDPRSLATPGGMSQALLTSSGITVADIDDLGAGRGPAWLDEWFEANSADVVAWRRHIHANPELSRHEYATTELGNIVVCTQATHEPEAF